MLGIETSCDETAAAVVDGPRQVRASVVLSQIAEHASHGGVVPEVAARLHAERLPTLVEQALREAGTDWPDLDSIAVTAGPGLATSLLVGTAAAITLALRLGRPLWAVHHLDAHLQSILLDPAFPMSLEGSRGLALLVSGGHTCLVLVDGKVRRLVGATFDDAAGEALDKGARLLGLGYPGGPAIERAAKGGQADAVEFPRGELSDRDAAELRGLSPALCFSFSGLKTALLYYLRRCDRAPANDVAASYQEAVVDALAIRLRRGVEAFSPDWLGCAGGVARNDRLRTRLAEVARELGRPLYLAPAEYCTDNAAMVAAAAAAGRAEHVEPPEALCIRPTWPLPVT